MQNELAGSDQTPDERDTLSLDPRYVAFFDCFNRQLFYEAHDVLEGLWLEVRHDKDGNFYKGLIQLAGAFVHWQKERPGPARALLVSARSYLGKYPDCHVRLDLPAVLRLAEEWIRWLDPIARGQQPWSVKEPPQLRLTGPALPVN